MDKYTKRTAGLGGPVVVQMRNHIIFLAKTNRQSSCQHPGICRMSLK